MHRILISNSTITKGFTFKVLNKDELNEWIDKININIEISKFYKCNPYTMSKFWKVILSITK